MRWQRVSQKGRSGLDGGQLGFHAGQLRTELADFFVRRLLHVDDGLFVGVEERGHARFELLRFRAQGGGDALLAGDRIRTRRREAHQLQFQDDLLHAGAANGRILRGTVAHHMIDGGSSGGRRNGDGQRNGERVGVVSIESAAADQHLENDGAEGEDIATRVSDVALKDLRGGIGGDGLRLSLRDDQLEAGSVDRNVRWGESAERTSFVVYLTEGLGQQCGITQSLRCGKWSFGQTTAES